MRVIFLRHCESAYNAATAEMKSAANTAVSGGVSGGCGSVCELRDAGLSATGREQAAALAAEAPKLFGSVTRVLSSPLARAVATASAIASVLRLNVEVIECAREVRRDVGDLGAKLHGGAVDCWWRVEGCGCPELFECQICVKLRVRQLLNVLHVLKRQGVEVAMVVSHGDFIHEFTGKRVKNCGTVVAKIE